LVCPVLDSRNDVVLDSAVDSSDWSYLRDSDWDLVLDLNPCDSDLDKEDLTNHWIGWWIDRMNLIVHKGCAELFIVTFLRVSVFYTHK